MTKQIVAGTLAALMIGLVAVACDENADTIPYGSGGGGGECHRYASCGTCTPVPGCGWCATGPTDGLCASDPDECAAAASFSWTWNATGCFVSADASVSAPTEAGSSDAGVGLAVDGATTASGVDAGDQDIDAGSRDAAPEADAGAKVD